jgi:hypothetical protein
MNEKQNDIETKNNTKKIIKITTTKASDNTDPSKTFANQSLTDNQLDHHV